IEAPSVTKAAFLATFFSLLVLICVFVVARAALMSTIKANIDFVQENETVFKVAITIVGVVLNVTLTFGMAWISINDVAYFSEIVSSFILLLSVYMMTATVMSKVVL